MLLQYYPFTFYTHTDDVLILNRNM